MSGPSISGIGSGHFIMINKQLFVNFIPIKDGIKIFYNCSEEQLKIVLERYTNQK